MFGPEIFPDVELLLTGFLRSTLAALADAGAGYAGDVTVSNRLPNPRPARAVTIRCDGGRRVTEVTEATRVGVNVWAGSEQDAADLARLVAAVLLAWAPPPVAHVEGGAFAAVADESGQPRRYGTFTLTLTPETLAPPA